MSIKIYSDGSCLGNPGYGGVGISVCIDEKFYSTHFSALSFYCLDNDFDSLKVFIDNGISTNNRMEILGLIQSIELIKNISKVSEEARCQILSDSQYVVKAMNEWINGWKRNNWINSKKKIVENVDMWKFIDSNIVKSNFGYIVNDIKCSVNHIKAHQSYTGIRENDLDIRGNNLADEEANKASQELQDIYNNKNDMSGVLQNHIDSLNTNDFLIFIQKLYSENMQNEMMSIINNSENLKNTCINAIYDIKIQTTLFNLNLYCLYKKDINNMHNLLEWVKGNL